MCQILSSIKHQNVSNYLTMDKLCWPGDHQMEIEVLGPPTSALCHSHLLFWVDQRVDQFFMLDRTSIAAKLLKLRDVV